VIYRVPNNFASPLTFNVMLDNMAYTLIVYYLTFGQRLYFKIIDNSGKLVVNLPLVSNKNMIAGYFTDSTMSYLPIDQVVEILP